MIGPLDVVALGFLYTGITNSFSNTTKEQTLSVGYFTSKNVNKKGFYDSMGQRGNNDKRLEPEELERITAKSQGERTSAEKQKLKAHEKATQQRGSRHSKGGKKR